MTTATGAPHNASLEPNPIQGQHGFIWDFLSDRPEAEKRRGTDGAASHAQRRLWLKSGDSNALGCLPSRRGSIWARSRRTPRSCHPRPHLNRRRPDPQRFGQQRYGQYQSAIDGGDDPERFRRHAFFRFIPRARRHHRLEVEPGPRWTTGARRDHPSHSRDGHRSGCRLEAEQTR